MDRNEPALLDEMRSTLDRILFVIRSAQDGWHGDYADVSPARSDWTSCVEPYAFDLEETYHTGMVQWHAIQDLTRGLLGSIDLRLPFSAVSAARSVAENAARSWYLLEADITALERVRRCLNDRLYANFEDERLLRGLLVREDMPPEILAVADQAEPVIATRLDYLRRVRENLVASAKRYGLTATNTNRDDKLSVVGTPRPSDQKVIGLAIGQPTQAATLHRVCSAVTHRSLHGMTRMFEIDASSVPHVSRVRPMTPDDLAGAIWAAVATLVISAQTLFRQAGWDSLPLDAAIGAAVAVWDRPPDSDLLDKFERLQ